MRAISSLGRKDPNNLPGPADKSIRDALAVPAFSLNWKSPSRLHHQPHHGIDPFHVR